MRLTTTPMQTAWQQRIKAQCPTPAMACCCCTRGACTRLGLCPLPCCGRTSTAAATYSTQTQTDACPSSRCSLALTPSLALSGTQPCFASRDTCPNTRRCCIIHAYPHTTQCRPRHPTPQRVVLEYRMDGTVSTSDDPPCVLGRLPAAAVAALPILTPGTLLRFVLGMVRLEFSGATYFGSVTHTHRYTHRYTYRLAHVS